MKSRIFLFLIIGMFALSFTSALVPTSTFDENTGEYGKYIIEDWMGLGSPIEEAILRENTFDCGQFCEATKEITLYEETSLVNGVRFYKINEDGSQELSNIRNYKLEYYGNIIDYETQCTDGENIVEENGTVYTPQNCEQVEIGNHQGWKQFSEGQIFEGNDKGITYLVRLSGEKRPDWTYDWQIQLQNSWTSEWAVWGVSDMTNGLVAHYKLNSKNFSASNQTQVVDSTGVNNGTYIGKTFNDGTAIGGVTIEDGAMKFDGVDDYMGYNGSSQIINASSDFTLSAWVQLNSSNSTSGGDAIILRPSNDSGSSGFWLGVRDISTTQFRARRFYNATCDITTTSTGTSKLDGNWYLVTGVFSSTNQSIYVNGILQASTTPTVSCQGLITSPIYNVTKMGIGSTHTGGAGSMLNGSIDNVMIYNRSLSSTEIEGLYALGRTNYTNVTSGIVAQYSGRDYAGTASAPTTIYDTNQLANGKINQGFGFDGVNDYVSTPINPVTYNFNTTNFSGCVWSKRMNGSDTNARILHMNDYNLLFIDYNTVSIASFTQNPVTYDLSNTQDWNHYCFVKNETRYSWLYVDGSLVAEGNVPSTGSFNNLSIGDRSSLDRSLNGSIDDVRIYNRSLSASEIAYLYNNGTGTEADPNAYVTLNSPSDGSTQYTTLVTTSASANVTGGATLVNATLYDNSTGSWGARNVTTWGITQNRLSSTTYGSTSSQTQSRGIAFNVTEESNQIIVEKDSSSTNTRAWLYFVNGTFITNGTYSGNNVTLTHDFKTGVTYLVMFDSAGTSYTDKYTTRTFPITNSTITWVNGYYDDTYGTGSDITPLLDSGFLHTVWAIYTSSAATTKTVVYNNTYSIGSTTLWNYQFCDSDGACGFATSNYTFNVDSIPPQITLNYPTSLINYGAVNGTLQLNFTVTDANLDKCWYDYNGTNSSLISCTTGVANLANITLSSKKNVTLYANDTVGNLNATTLSWDYLIFENSRVYNTTSYETAYETYSINLTANSSLTNVYLNLNGNYYETSNSSNVWSYSLDLPESSVGNNSVSWVLTHAGTNITSDTSYQNILNTVFALCNVTYTVPYLNITFKDEATLGSINATMPLGEFTYYLGTGSVNKTTQNINTSENAIYSFCVSPSNRALNVDPYVQYASSGYPQRIWNPSVTSYNNTTTVQVLYLLSSADGIYVTFQVINSADQLLEGVEVIAVREISGTDVTVATGTTDAAGTVTFWLNPDFTHDFTFTKTGFDTYSTSFAPTQTSYTITMAGGDTGTIDDYTRGITLTFAPIQQELFNDTAYTFSFNVGSSFWDLTSFSFNLRLANGTIVASPSSSTEGVAASTSYNVNNQSIIYMDYRWVINGTTTTGTKFWIVTNTENTGWSVKHFFTRLQTYMGVGFFGLDNFGRYLIVFIILFITIGVMSYKYGLTSPLAVMTMIFLVIYFFDVVVNLIPTIRGIDNLLTYIAGIILAVVVLKEVTQ